MLWCFLYVGYCCLTKSPGIYGGGRLSRRRTDVAVVLCRREKKREKERDELWKRLAELELNHGKKSPPNHSAAATLKK